jgi:hypothetical protein
VKKRESVLERNRESLFLSLFLSKTHSLLPSLPRCVYECVMTWASVQTVSQRVCLYESNKKTRVGGENVRPQKWKKGNKQKGKKLTLQIGSFDRHGDEGQRRTTKRHYGRWWCHDVTTTWFVVYLPLHTTTWFLDYLTNWYRIPTHTRPGCWSFGRFFFNTFRGWQCPNITNRVVSESHKLQILLPWRIKSLFKFLPGYLNSHWSLFPCPYPEP